MDLLVIGVLGAIAIVTVTAVAPRVGVSAPLLLVVLGVGLSFLPIVPAVEIEPEWILAGLLPPLLYSTSVSMPTMDFRRDFTAISGLSVVLVVISSVLLGFLFARLIPDVPLATGIALGAIVSPTDAVATSIVRKLGVSPRLVTVLEGESLLNDASALVLLRSAIAATAVSVSLVHVAAEFVYAVAVAVVVGVVVGWLSLVVRRHVTDASITTAISFVVPFVAYLPAEHLDASGLVATVTAGLVAGAGSAKHLRPADRLAESANWRTLEVLLEGTVFLVMGLQLFGVVEEAREHNESLRLPLVLGVLAAVGVVVVRAGFLAPLLVLLKRRARRSATSRDFLTGVQQRIDGGDLGPLATFQQGYAEAEGRPAQPSRGRRSRVADGAAGSGSGATGDAVAGGRRGATAERAVPARRGGPRGEGAMDPATRARVLSHRITRRVADIDYLAAEPLGRREGIVLVWAGMRGAVTLAAAQSLPADTPQRPTLVLIAFVVAAGTLLVQGGTLPWVVRRLDLSRASVTDHAERRALVEALRQAAADVFADPELRRRDGGAYDDGVLDRVRRVVATQDEDLEDVKVGDDVRDARAREAAQVRELRLAMIEAQRAALLEARRLGTYSSAALRDALTVLDADQLSAELRGPDGGE